MSPTVCWPSSRPGSAPAPRHGTRDGRHLFPRARRAQVNYPAFRAPCWPRGSGASEDDNKQIRPARMKRRGCAGRGHMSIRCCPQPARPQCALAGGSGHPAARAPDRLRAAAPRPPACPRHPTQSLWLTPSPHSPPWHDRSLLLTRPFSSRRIPGAAMALPCL